MIKLIDDDFNNIDLLNETFKDNSFGTRVLSILTTYDKTLDFVDVWYQIINDSITAIISRFEDRITVSANKKSDVNEISEFLNFQNFNYILCDSKLKLKIDFKSKRTGDVLKFPIKNTSFKEDKIIKPNIEDYYSILKKCENENFVVPEYMNFLSDITYRQNRGKCAMFGMKDEDKLASVCMTVSESSSSVILGAVATSPEFKKRGYCTKLLRTVASLFLLNNYDVYIYSLLERNTELYKKIGFEKDTKFIEYLR